MRRTHVERHNKERDNQKQKQKQEQRRGTGNRGQRTDVQHTSTVLW